MVTDNQVRILMKLVNQEKLLKTAAAKAGMSEKTARKYRKSGKLPGQCKVVHDWRTRQDPTDPNDWHLVEEVLENNDGIEAKTLSEFLQREYPYTLITSRSGMPRERSNICPDCEAKTATVSTTATS